VIENQRPALLPVAVGFGLADLRTVIVGSLGVGDFSGYVLVVG